MQNEKEMLEAFEVEELDKRYEMAWITVQPTEPNIE